MNGGGPSGILPERIEVYFLLASLADARRLHQHPETASRFFRDGRRNEKVSLCERS